MGTRLRGLLGGALIALAAIGLAAQEAPRVAPRDQLTIAVVGITELSTKCTVSEDGTCVLTYLGAVPVTGLTAREVAAEIARLLKERDIHRSPQVTAELVQMASRQVTVSGAVRTQGVQMFAGDLTVFDALLRAGGASNEAADEILVVRRPAEAAGRGADASDEDLVVRISRSLLESGDRESNIALADGDHVIVPRAEQVFISGYVRSPGPYTVDPGITLRQALVLAGGVTERGSDRRVDILRKNVDGKEEKVRDVTLSTPIEAGDTIIVKSRFF